ncbi:MAG: class I SAM-dependent methyltransferase [Nitrospinae bacterium]|nr:class I SAM-dependent methyltransferase [Nitrospinota bacterium]
MKRVLYRRCKELNARIAIVGSKTSAGLLIGALENTDVPVVGVYERPPFREPSIIRGHPLRPIEELSRLDPDDAIVIASSAEATQLYDTIALVQSLCPCRTLHLKSLLDVFLLREELKIPLQFQFDEFLFGRGLFPEPGESPFWHPIPPKIDFRDKTVLELGPFEGNVSSLIMAQNPKKVIGLEARPLNYAKFSVMRSLHNWKNYHLLLGDMHLFPQLVREKIDIIYCSGVLYHSEKPWWLLKSCLDQCDTVVLGTHVASEFSRHPRITEEVVLESGTYRFEIYPEKGWNDGLAGVAPKSLWFTEEDLVRFAGFYGFRFERYDSFVSPPTGLWIHGLITKTQ